MAAVAATAALPGDGGAGEAEPIPGTEAGAEALPAGTLAAVESAVLDAREEPEPAPGGEAEEPPPPPPRSPAGTGDPPQAQPSPEPLGEMPEPCLPTAAFAQLRDEEEKPQPCLPLSPPPPAAGGPAGPEPGEEPPRPEEEEPDAAAGAKQPAFPGTVDAAAPVAERGEAAAEVLLLPGSEVLVTLDHIIEDALVVSFRFGEKLFSGVLMDLSKR